MYSTWWDGDAPPWLSPWLSAEHRYARPPPLLLLVAVDEYVE